MSLPRHISVYDKAPRSYPSHLFLEIWYHLTQTHQTQPHQQKRILRLIRRRCVLTQATYFLRPLRSVRSDLCCSVPCVLTQRHILPTSRLPQTLDLVLLASSPRPDVSRPSSPLSQLQLIRCFLRRRPASFFFHISRFTSHISRLIGLVN